MFHTWHRRLIGFTTSLFLAMGLTFVSASPSHAKGWTQLFGSDGGALLACKQAVDSPYGPLWRVQTIIINWGAPHRHSASVQVWRDAAYTGTLINTWRASTPAGGTSSLGVVFLSRIAPDFLTFGFGEPNGQGAGGDQEIEFIDFC
jgi:hypothetical protein